MFEQELIIIGKIIHSRASIRLPYEERLRRPSLHSLIMRCLCEDLIPAYNVFAGGLGLDPNPFFNRPARPDLMGHSFKVLEGHIRRLRNIRR